MGNSNSISQFTPNEIDLRQRAHWQYLSQQQKRATFQPSPANTTSIKVLPELNDGNGHLRSTDNGVILFNGGTISGRRESIGVVRSKSISSPQHEARYVNGLQRHNTQLDMPGIRAGPGLRRDVDPKIFGSEPDLRMSPADANNGRNSRKFKGQNGQPMKLAPNHHQQQSQRDYDSSRFGWRPKSQQQPIHHQQHHQQNHNHTQHNQDRTLPMEPKKPRLFKTREETKKVSSKANQSKLASEASDMQSKKPSSARQTNVKRDSGPVRDDSTTDRVIKVIGNGRAAPVPEKLLPKAEVLSKPVFRREKSFDISLLLSRGAQKGTSLFPNVFRKSSTTDKNPPAIQTDKVTQRRQESIQDDKTTIKTRRASQPPPAKTTDNFQKELQEATRRRSMLVPLKEDQATTNNKQSNIQKSSVTQSPVLKAISKPRAVNENAKAPQQQKAMAPKPPIPQSPKVEANKIQLEIRYSKSTTTTTGSLIEQSSGDAGGVAPAATQQAMPGELLAAEKPVKSFYYGMPEQERIATSSPRVSRIIQGSTSAVIATAEDTNGVAVDEKVALTAIESFAESIFAMNKKQQQLQQQQNYQRDSSESAVSSEAGDASLLYSANERNNKGHNFDEDTLEGISLQLRPTLPKKQFEIPRFSPAAAWRLLSTENSREVNQMKCLDQLEVASSGDDTNDRNPDRESRGEEQIERIFREPIPGLADNKSGDSGISGDGGLLELGENNNLLVNDLRKLGPFLQPWTPQQDLEDDSSSDPDPDNNNNNNNNKMKDHRTRDEEVVAQKHVFSLSLPRDNQNNGNLSDKAGGDKHFFSSLQKTKIGHCYPESITGRSQQAPTSVSGNDNWFLGRSQPNSIEKNPMPSLSDNEEAVCTTNNSIVQHHQPAIQPPSFNYLAGGCHFMYLPNRTSSSSNPASASLLLTTSITNNGNSPSIISATEKVNNGPPPPLPQTPAPIKECAVTGRENLQDQEDQPIWNVPLKASRKGHRFTFQSTVRQIERKKLADKLSREAGEREVQRLSELKAMQKVEEEFQKKRAREKASIRQQLRLFSMEAAAEANNNFCSNGSINQQFNFGQSCEFSPSSIRREPDGAAEASGNKIGAQYCHKSLQINGYKNQDYNHHQEEQQLHHHRQQYQSMANSILARDYSKFPYREFLK